MHPTSRAALLAVATFALAACAPRTDGARAPDAALPSAPPSAPASASASAPAPPPPPSRRVPVDAAECQAMLGTPDAARSDATVTPERGSGKSERFAGIVAALKSQRGALRCCYDLWAKDNPRDAGLTLAFAIDEAGVITGIQIKGDSGDPFAMQAGACLVDVALGIRYPASPTGKVTTFEYDLGFKHHKAPPAP